MNGALWLATLRQAPRGDGGLDRLVSPELGGSRLNDGLKELLVALVAADEGGRLQDLGDVLGDPNVQLRQVTHARPATKPCPLALDCHRVRLYTLDSSTHGTADMPASSMSSESATQRTLERVLAREAERLGAAGSLPLDLGPVLADLGIAVRAEVPNSPGRGHGWLQRTGSRWQIVVDARTGAARQRYTIAHELGHYVIEAWTGYRPSTRRDYWLLETACQRFAADLLAPRQVVESALGAAVPSPVALMEAIDRLIAMTDLSLEAAARRTIDTASYAAAALALRLPADGSPSRRFAQLLWAHSNQPWIPGRRGRLIRKDHPLRATAQAAAFLDPGADMALSLPGARSSLMLRRQSGLVLIGAILEGRAA